jgi:hypothetical protein
MGLEALSGSTQPADPIMGAVSDLQKGRLTLDQQIQKMKETLVARQTPFFDPTALKVAGALLKPTRTGSAFESLGSAADALASEQEREFDQQMKRQKLELELEEKGLGIKQQMAGFAQMQNLFGPQGAPQSGGMMPTTGSVPTTAPATRTAAPPVVATGQPAGTVPMGEGAQTSVEDAEATRERGETPATGTQAGQTPQTGTTGYTLPTSAVDAGVKPTDKPGVVQTPLGTVNLGTMRQLTERDLILAQNISPAQAKTIKELMDVQKDFRAYSIDVAKLGIQQAELRLNERRTVVAEANLAIDQAKLKQTDFAEIDFGTFGRQKVALSTAQEWAKLIQEGDQTKINEFLKKNKITSFEGDRPLTESEKKVRDAGLEASAKGQADLDVDFMKNIRNSALAARDLERLAKDQINFVNARPGAFNYLQNDTLKDAVFRAIADIDEAARNQVQLKPSQLIGYFQGLKKEDREVWSQWAEKAAQVSLAFAKMEMKGQGAVSDAERRLVDSISGTRIDSADTIRLKSEALILRAEKDRAINDAWIQYKKESGSSSVDGFLTSKQYLNTMDKFDEKFQAARDAIARLYGGGAQTQQTQQQSQGSGSLVDQLNQATRGARP